MCVGIALAWSELPVELIDAHGLTARVYERGGEREIRFLWREVPSLLPVWWNGRLHVARWGNRERRSALPQGGWTWEATIEAGGWANASAEPVDLPASYVWAGGVWLRVRHGVRALLVPAPANEGGPAVYLICRPSTRYYRIATRCEFQPVLIGESI